VPLSNTLMPAVLQTLGYRTVMYGKWNIGHCNSKYLPHERGFDHFLGYMGAGHGYTEYQGDMSIGVRDLLEGFATADAATGEVAYSWATGEQYLGTYDTSLYTAASVAAVAKHAKTYRADPNGTPLFMWLAQHGIHGEMDANPEPPEALLTAENKVYLAALKKSMGDHEFYKKRYITATVLMTVDNSLKALVDALDTHAMLSNAVVFVNSDNGGSTNYVKGHPGNNFPMRSLKWSYFEGGIRVPAFVFAPGRLPPSRQGTSYHGMVHHVDLLTTFYAMGGGDVSALKATAQGRDLDGCDHWGALQGLSTSPRQELVLNLPRSRDWTIGQWNHTEQGVALRVGQYKLLVNHAEDGWFEPSPASLSTEMWASQCQYGTVSYVTLGGCDYNNYLFDLTADPTELSNLYYSDDADVRKVKASLIARAEELVAAQGNYGTILHHAVDAPVVKSTVLKQFEAHNFFATPWGYDAIP
jgi:arylsulfatase B